MGKPVRKRATRPPEAGEPAEAVVPRPRTPRSRTRLDDGQDLADGGFAKRVGKYRTSHHAHVTGGAVLAIQSSTAAGTGVPSEDGTLRLSFGWTGPWLRRHKAVAVDVLAVLVASLDVAMAVPAGAATYSLVLSAIAVFALLFRRRFPFAPRPSATA